MVDVSSSMRNLSLSIAVMLCSVLFTQAQSVSAHEHLREADEAFRQNQFADAELHYRRAIEKQPSFQSHYNLGIALAKQGRHPEAVAAFESAEALAQSDAQRAAATYNAATAHLAEQNLKASIEQYAETLRRQPKDEQARQNLAQALRQLRVQQQQQPQAQSSQAQEEQDADSKQKEQEQEQSPSPEQQDRSSDSAQDQTDDSAQREAAEREQESSQSTDDQAPDEEAEAATQPGELTKDEAERLLNIAADQERRTHEKMRVGEQSRNKPLKDW